MLWTPTVITAEKASGSDVYSTLLLAAMRAFREVEAEADAGRRREGLAMAEFAEIVVAPGLGRR